MKTQKELKKLYEENLKLAWDDPRMVEYCAKQADQVVETEDGWLLEVERQHIEKNFCFGYGYCGVTSQEEIDDAYDRADYCKKDVKGFMNKNLKWYDAYISELEDETNDVYVSKIGKYYSQKPGCKLQNFYIDTHSCYGYENTKDTNKWKLMCKEDRKNLLDAFKAGKEGMIKRLNTYLKKFGLSKLHVWTYLSD